MSLKSLQDEIKPRLPELIRRIRNGDSSAKDEFAILLMPYIKILVNKYRHSIDDDITSFSGYVIFLVLQKIDTIDLDKPILEYITRICINYCIDTHRRNQIGYRSKKNRLEYLETESYSIGVSDTESDLSNLQFLLESNFNKTDATILSMYYLSNNTVSEISNVTGQKEEDIQETINFARAYVF